jgi:hypothetical protein
MLKLPQSVIFAIVALNLTGFTILLQLDLLIFNAPIEKVIAWIFTIGAWTLTYTRRNKYFTML